MHDKFNETLLVKKWVSQISAQDENKTTMSHSTMIQ